LYSSWETAQLVNVAFQCSAAVYSANPKSYVVHDADGPNSSAGLLHRKPVLDGVEFKELDYIDCDWKSLAKAVGFWQADCSNLAGQSSSPPIWVIAVRGTQKILDNLVNLNGRPADVTEWLVSVPISVLDTATYCVLRVWTNKSPRMDFRSLFMPILALLQVLGLHWQLWKSISPR
jgi:hypothetical protein